jgi:flagellar basal body-associated protein FliL
MSNIAQAFFFAVANGEIDVFLVSIVVIFLLGCLFYSPWFPSRSRAVGRRKERRERKK